MATQDETSIALGRLHANADGAAEGLAKLTPPLSGLPGILKGMGVGQVNVTKGSEALGRALREQLSITGEVTAGLGTLTKQLAGGNADLTVFNTVIDTATGLVGGLAKTIPYLGEAINAVVKATGEAAKLILSRLDSVSKAFTEIGSVGALATDGMQGIADQAAAAGLSVGAYTKVIVGSSTVMARFQTTAAAGAEEFSKLSGSISKYDSAEGLQLRKLGKGVLELTDGVAGFITQQATTGLAQRKTTDQLKVGAIGYIKELDILTRMTGVSAKALQDQEQQALTESRFLAVIRTAENEGRLEGANNLKMLSKEVSSTRPMMGKAIRDLSTGAAISKASQQLQDATGGAAMGIIREASLNLLPWPDAIQKINDALKKNEGSMLLQAMRAEDTDVLYGALEENIKGITSETKKSFDNAQAGQAAALAAIQNTTTKAIDAMVEVEKLQRKMDEEAFKAIGHAATAAAKLGEALNATADLIYKAFGTETTAYKAIDYSMKGLGTLGGALLGGSIGSFAGPAGTLVGASAGGGAGYAAGVSASNSLTSLLGIQQYKTAQTAPQTRGFTPTSAAPTSAAPSAAAAPPTPIAQAILNLKSKESTAGGDAVPELLTLAHKIQNMYPGARFTALNDAYHQKKYPGSLHAQGKALDFTLPKAPTPAEGAAIVASLRSMGFAYAQDEYAKLSPGGTGGHFHAQLAAEKGGVVSGPRSGYSATLHGTEAVVPLPDGRSIPVSNPGGSGSMEIQVAQLSALEELVSTMKNQVSISSKILQYAA